LSAHAVLCKMTVDVISVQYLLITYRARPTTWCFSHDLDMVEIETLQLRDTGLNVQSPFALPRISTSNCGIFKD